jgi:hypothetical protein
VQAAEVGGDIGTMSTMDEAIILTNIHNMLLSLANVAGQFKIFLPAERPIEPFTLAHMNSAERTYSWSRHFWRGGDMAIVLRQTPFLAETKQDLWQYYQSIPLDPCPERLVMFALVEMGLYNNLDRKRYPRLRRCLDLYMCAIGVACLVPRRLFYHIHWWYWKYEFAVAKARSTEPFTPLLGNSDISKDISAGVYSLLEIFGLGDAVMKPRPKVVGAPSGRGLLFTTLLTVGGVGLAVWHLGLEESKTRFRRQMTNGLDRAKTLSERAAERGLLNWLPQSLRFLVKESPTASAGSQALVVPEQSTLEQHMQPVQPMSQPYFGAQDLRPQPGYASAQGQPPPYFGAQDPRQQPGYASAQGQAQPYFGAQDPQQQPGHGPGYASAPYPDFRAPYRMGP